ncbi:uncharacterized protein METZ01_LOCUS6112, partial [marine metagenome]
VTWTNLKGRIEAVEAIGNLLESLGRCVW